jgi:adenylate cyclase
MSESNSAEPADAALGYLVVAGSDGASRTVPIFDQLFVGRQCSGISDERRLVIADHEISRNHLEIRLDGAADNAFVIDMSTNGTLLNGMRLERAVPVPLMPGDQLHIGDIELTFISTRFTSGEDSGDIVETRTRISQSTMVGVVGDITNYSTISEVTDHTVVAESLHVLWRELGRILRAHRGSLNHYAGDALYAIWEPGRVADAEVLAIEFALAANRRVQELGPELPLRGPDGSSISMGWSVVHGMAALAAMTRSVEAIIGDTTNVAFRLASIAGRNGRPPVLVTREVYTPTKSHFEWGASEDVPIKGRKRIETVFPVIGHAPIVEPSLQTRPVPTHPAHK